MKRHRETMTKAQRNNKKSTEIQWQRKRDNDTSYWETMTQVIERQWHKLLRDNSKGIQKQWHKTLKDNEKEHSEQWKKHKVTLTEALRDNDIGT